MLIEVNYPVFTSGSRPGADSFLPGLLHGKDPDDSIHQWFFVTLSSNSFHMKRIALTLICIVAFLSACTEETPRAELLEYNIGGKLYTFKGYAYRYTDYIGAERQGLDWHIYNLGQSSLYIQAYDTSFGKTIFPYPEFDARFIVELAGGISKTYQASAGEFRILGQEMGDVLGDFHCRVKNISDPTDSLVITGGYYRIWLEKYDRVFSKK